MPILANLHDQFFNFCRTKRRRDSVPFRFAACRSGITRNGVASGIVGVGDSAEVYEVESGKGKK